MSCILAISLPDIALVCADTRINIFHRDGSISTNDIGELTITYPDGRSRVYGDLDRKMRRIPGGWAAGAGCSPLIDVCLSNINQSNLRTPNTLAALLQTTYQKEFSTIKHDFPFHTDISQTAITFTYTLRSRFGLGGVCFNDNLTFMNEGSFFASPPELQGGNVTSALNKVRQSEALTGKADLLRLIRDIAALFHEVHLHSRSVSDYLDVGLSIREIETGVVYARLCTSNTEILGADDETLFSKIIRV